MKLAVKASQAAHEDLSDFFELWGFFIPGKGVIEQYGTYDYLVTEEMIRKAKAEMSIYPKPKHAFNILKTVKPEILVWIVSLRMSGIIHSLKVV